MSFDSFLLNLILYLPKRPLDNLFIRTEPDRDATPPGVAFLGKYAFLPVHQYHLNLHVLQWIRPRVQLDGQPFDPPHLSIRLQSIHYCAFKKG